MNDDELYAMLVDANDLGGIYATCKVCGDEIYCEPDAMNAWCDNCDKVVRVHGLASMGCI